MVGIIVVRVSSYGCVFFVNMLEEVEMRLVCRWFNLL